MTTIDEFNKWLQGHEDVNLEFKSAENSFSANKDLPDYCAAISNEGGGKLILGVAPDHRIIGTRAFQNTHNKLSHDLLQNIRLRIDVEELHHPEGRILIFHIPSHPIGQPVKSTGKYKYPMRAGESLVEMDNATLRRILNETETDFSSQIVMDLSLADIDDQAIDNFKKLWAKKAQRDDYLSYSNEKTLRSIGLLSEKGLNYASLILFGKKEKIDELAPGSEIIFEWRHDSKKIAYDFRKNWREPFFKIYNDIWETINARNIRFPFQEGLFQREIYAFSEKPVREAVLNAVAHRDYTINSRSVFIKASPEEFIVETPGGLPHGVTIENILRKTYWRNRRIAETFEKASLVERSGQGMDDIFENTIKEGKGLPDFPASDDFSFRLRIPAQVKDKNFILFIEKITREKQITLSFDEVYELEKIREHQPVTELEYKNIFLDIGIIERVGETRGAKYILSHKYYTFEGKSGVHTRIAGLKREQKKTLILNHLKKNKEGARNKDFQDAFPDMRQSDINNLLQELKEAGVKHIGSRRSGRWILETNNN